MNQITMTKLSRRSFIIGSAAVAGGVAFGGYASAADAANPLAKGLAKGSATFNPWVIIGPRGVTLITPHGDIGQGAVSVQAALIAEEMDLDLGQFEISFGPPDVAYVNTGLADEFVPFESYDRGPPAMAAREAAAKYIKEQNFQMTGGSSTVPDSYEKLRVAGAVARETIKAAAAKRTGTPVADLKTASGAVVLPDGRKIAYTALAADAARIEPVENVKLRDPSQWRILGKPMRRVDIVAKSNGTQKFGIDLAMKGMLHASVRLNPRKGAAMTSFDASAAQKMPGVGKVLEITNGVAVVATNSWYAMKAVDAIKAQWAAAAYPAEQAQHWAVMQASFSPANQEKVWRSDGDVAQALTGPGVIEAEYRAPYVGHQPLEPLNGLALVTSKGADIWVGHQVPNVVQQMVAKIVGHKPENVTFHNQFMGGSFGHRLEFENVRAVAEIANLMRGTPVKLTFSREEDFLQDFPRQLSMGRMKGAIADGKIVAADFHVSSTPVMSSMFGRMGGDMPGPDAQTPLGVRGMSYAIPNLRVTTYAAKGLSPVSSWRSVGASTGGFFSEGFIDELIHAAKLDPMKARIDMCTVDYHRKVLEAVAQMSDWNGPLGNGKGRGVAFVESFGVACAEVIEVSVTDKGVKIDKVWVAADVGPVLDPVNFENHVQGAVVFGLGHAMNCELTYKDGAVEQRNYSNHEGMRLYQCPKIEVRGLANGPTIRGIGEPPVPPAAPALANAIFAATGKRIREMPFNKFIDFV